MGRPRKPLELIDQLSSRETEVLELMSQGLTNQLIANRLKISETTVKTHLKHAFKKLEAYNRAHAVRVGFERGYLKVD